MGTKHVLLTL